ncbi:hypothetical protein BC332_33594 [Capsicum chinense]|nr:hypothetical protein BC332_33594 [Capsicum chinense]
MENSQQPLATESFSYSWLLNRKLSIDGLTESPRPSYSSHDDAEENLKFITYLKRFLKEEQNFNFDVHPVSESVCADEIFFDGYIMPRYLDRSKIQSFREAFNNFNTNSSVPSTGTPPTPISKLSNPITSQADFLEKWRKFSRKILVKWFGFGSPRQMLKSYSVVNWCGNDNNQRSSSSTRRVKSFRKVKNWSNIKSQHEACSPIKSPSNDHSTDVWREKAISDAILYCKRSYVN